MYITESIFGYLQFSMLQNFSRTRLGPGASKLLWIMHSRHQKVSRLALTQWGTLLNRSQWLLCWPTPFGCMTRRNPSRHMPQHDSVAISERAIKVTPT